MRTATVGEIQKNFGRVLKEIRAGEVIIVTKRGTPVAKITGLGPKSEIEWPDFFKEALEIKGKSVSEILIEEREDRF